jgi:hypothetical protein
MVLLVLVAGGFRATMLALQLLVGVLVVSVLSRRPDRALLLVITFVPLQQILLALLLSAGAPVALVRSLGLVKEAVVASLVVAAVQRGARVRLDRLDGLALTYLGLVSLYLVAPLVLPGVFADLPFSVRGLAWRDNALFVVAFLAARRVPLPPGFLRRAGIAVTAVAVVAALCALVEFFLPHVWSQFLIKVAHIRLYRALVFGDVRPPTDELSHILVGGRDVIRVGSVALSPLHLGFLLLVPLAFCLERVSGARARALGITTTVLVSVALVTTLTRSAILGGLLVMLVTLRMGVTRLQPGRIQLAIGLALAVVLVAPLAGSSTVVERATSTFSGDESAAGHRTSSLEAAADVLKDPLGRGLGTSPGVGLRFDVRSRVTSENAYLQVGAELGLATMVVFVLLLGAVLVHLRRRARSGSADAWGASALLAAGSGLALGGMFLHVWLDLATALTFWSLAGVALAAPLPQRPERPPATSAREAAPATSSGRA